MIPQMLHQIWLGSPVPAKLHQWQERFLDLNPGWICDIWTEGTLSPMMDHVAAWHWSTEPRHRADVARLEILYHYGGLYADADIEWFNPLPEEVELWNEARAAMDYGGYLNNCALAAPAGDLTIAKLKDSIAERLRGPVNAPGPVVAMRTGPGLLWDVAPDIARIPPLVINDRLGPAGTLAAGVHWYESARLLA